MMAIGNAWKMSTDNPMANKVKPVPSEARKAVAN
jgi:hypothetical protein